MPENFTYFDFLSYLSNVLEDFDPNRTYEEQDKLNPRRIWDFTIDKWIYKTLYNLAMDNPELDPGDILFGFEEMVNIWLGYADGSEMMTGVLERALGELDIIREDIWEGWRE